MFRRSLSAIRSTATLTAVLFVALPTAGASAYHVTDHTPWADEAAMVASPNGSEGRATFITDPGQDVSWTQASLIAAHHDYYAQLGVGNVLTWGSPDRITPAASTRWAGCDGQIVGGRCTSGIHQAPVGNALIDRTIDVVRHGDAFIALACGNYSETVENPTPTISGAKFEDVNGNGSRDSGEPSLSGWTIQLHQDGRLLTSTTTNAQGNYSFSLDANSLDIRSENFEVREVQQSGWVASRTPGIVHVPFGSGNAQFPNRDFGNYRPATIGGVKYEDMEADGDQDSDDPTLPGWSIDLSGGPTAAPTAVTNASGEYELTGLRPGTYTVAEQLQNGWRYSSPSDGSHTITVQSGDSKTADFGNYRPATISGTKFDDHNVDRLWDTGEPGLAGWSIGLTGGRSPDATDSTDGNGEYEFTGLIPGTYEVGETLKAGWRQSAPASGTHSVTVRSGDTKTADFGNVCLGTADVRITEERTGEPLTGVEVRIEEVSVPGVLANEPTLPRTTSGTPTFADLLPGTYRVIAFLPTGVYTTDPDLTVVGGRLAVVKEIVVPECETTVVPIKMFTTSTGKVTGGMKMRVPGGFSTSGFEFMTRKGVAEGTLEYQDHVTGLNLHTKQIERIHVRGNEAWIGGVLKIAGTSYRFSLHLVDNGEPGTQDRFELLVENGYRAGYEQTIGDGNVQIHKPAPPQ